MIDQTKASKFLELAESLKLVRNSYAEHDGKIILGDIYTDLLPNDGILNKVNLPTTTILVGRKGTGKSTIFQMSQEKVDGKKGKISIYIDVKSLYDNSTPTLPNEIKQLPNSEEYIKYLIYSNFIQEIVLQVKKKLKQRFEKKSFVERLALSELIITKVYSELDNIETETNGIFKQLNANLITTFKNTAESQVNKDSSIGFEISPDTIKYSGGFKKAENNLIQKEFDNTLITYLDLKKTFINNIVKLRDILNVKHFYIYLDDYSEIEKDAQCLFMDWFIAPVNNLSDDFVKFKIATYPQRFYYGKLDNSKIDELSLDFFDAYYTIEKKNNITDISRMEHLALDYTMRLLTSRFNVFFGEERWEDLFDISFEELSELLFISTMNIPRKIGFILSYCYESTLIHGSKIGTSAIENAASRYYSDVVEKYFLVNEFVCKPFDDSISNSHQFDLLNHIIKRQLNNKDFLKGRRVKDTSHFFINSEFAYLLYNLELNGFLSTYNEVQDHNKTTSTVYCLDLGLCKKIGLIYGKPGEKNANSHKLPSLFNFNNLVLDYFNSTQVIRCKNGHEFPYAQLKEFQVYNMLCPECSVNREFEVCFITMKFAELRNKFREQEESEKIRVKFSEYIILDFLKKSQKPISYKNLSSSLDMSESSIASLIELLNNQGVTELDIEVSKALGKEFVKITSKGTRLVERVEAIIKEATNSNS